MPANSLAPRQSSMQGLLGKVSESMVSIVTLLLEATDVSL